MARPLPALTLTTEQQDILQTITRSRECSHGLVQRAQIILSASLGDGNKTIGQWLGLSEESVGMWRKRWLTSGNELQKFEGRPKQLREVITQLLSDKPRPGSPGVLLSKCA